ncbi:MAG: hypothetical protein IJG23_02510 [Clostridia bacterium]|nr:hypothetical protein [Clostridia bacterium]
MDKNMVKYENYKEQSKRLEKALKYHFYVEALAIEYAIIEDRIESVLKHSGFAILDKKGRPYPIQYNINRLKTGAYFNTEYMRKKIPVDLIDKIETWKNSRNKVIHALMKRTFESGEFERLAMEGNELRKQISSKSLMVKRFNDKCKE